MSNILLVCSAGISTSILVKSMNEYAEKLSHQGKIWAVGIIDTKESLEEADIVLLGPQIGNLLETIQKAAGDDTKVAVMDKDVYASGDGEKALKHAMELLGEID